MYVCWVGVGVGGGGGGWSREGEGRSSCNANRLEISIDIYIYINPSNRWSGKKLFKHKSPTPINSRTKLWPL